MYQFLEYVTIVQNLCCYLDFSGAHNCSVMSHWTDQLLNNLNSKA